MNDAVHTGMNPAILAAVEISEIFLIKQSQESTAATAATAYGYAERK